MLCSVFSPPIAHGASPPRGYQVHLRSHEIGAWLPQCCSNWRPQFLTRHHSISRPLCQWMSGLGGVIGLYHVNIEACWKLRVSDMDCVSGVDTPINTWNTVHVTHAQFSLKQLLDLTRYFNRLIGSRDMVEPVVYGWPAMRCKERGSPAWPEVRPCPSLQKGKGGIQTALNRTKQLRIKYNFFSLPSFILF